MIYHGDKDDDSQRHSGFDRPAGIRRDRSRAGRTREGSKRWAYKGKPLYLWSKDQKPGDMTGDGFNGIWHVIKD